jgi:hypothetical protein
MQKRREREVYIYGERKGYEGKASNVVLLSTVWKPLVRNASFESSGSWDRVIIIDVEVEAIESGMPRKVVPYSYS